MNSKIIEANKIWEKFKKKDQNEFIQSIEMKSI